MSLILINSNLKAETILFDSKNIKIEENGNMIFATEGKANIPKNNLIIEGDKFIYNKKLSELIVIDDVKYFDNENKIYAGKQDSGHFFAWPPWRVHGADKVTEPNVNRLIVAGNISLTEYYDLEDKRLVCQEPEKHCYVWRSFQL